MKLNRLCFLMSQGHWFRGVDFHKFGIVLLQKIFHLEFLVFPHSLILEFLLFLFRDVYIIDTPATTLNLITRYLFPTTKSLMLLKISIKLFCNYCFSFMSYLVNDLARMSANIAFFYGWLYQCLLVVVVVFLHKILGYVKQKINYST